MELENVVTITSRNLVPYKEKTTITNNERKDNSSELFSVE